jgi:hypothetical protein
VQIVHGSRRGTRDIEHLGSAHDVTLRGGWFRRTTSRGWRKPWRRSRRIAWSMLEVRELVSAT